MNSHKNEEVDVYCIKPRNVPGPTLKFPCKAETPFFPIYFITLRYFCRPCEIHIQSGTENQC